MTRLRDLASWLPLAAGESSCNLVSLYLLAEYCTGTDGVDGPQEMERK